MNTRNNSFISTTLIMLLMFLAFFGNVGCGGGHSSNSAENTPIYEPEPTPTPEPTPNGSFMVTFDSDGGSYVATQIVKSGETVAIPEEPDKDDNSFMGWYSAKGFSYRFNFDTPISRDITLYAKWWSNTDTIDSDGDGLIDSLEITFGTDSNDSDTDGDGITDFDELNFLNYNPLVKDTDGNGINDGDEDADGDGLTNIQEGNYGTSMITIDTDHDGLTDYEEIVTYGTDPLKYDTDEDGVDDGTEVAIGSNPLSKEEVFSTTFGSDMISDNPEAIDISVTMNTTATAAGSLRIMPADYSVHPLINSNIPGYLTAYNLSADDSIASATVTFTLGDDIEEFSSTFQPRIYYFNEETGLLEEIVNQKIEGRKIIATIEHFSTYILLNKIAFDEVWSQDIRPPSWNSDNTNLDIVFAIDYSASMNENDSTQKFKILSKNFISKLRDGKDRGAVVKFVDFATVILNLTTDKNALNSAIDSISYDWFDSNGYGHYGTDGSTGINEALTLLQTSSSGYKYIIFLTDGKDTRTPSYSYDSLIARAKAAGIVIYSIGMGTADEDLLKKVSSETQGKYYHATADEEESSGELLDLNEVYEEIESEVVDMTTDSNNDGISDYFTNLLNDGTLLLSNGSDILAGVLNNTSDDWDGDGLKNGEEIKVVVNGSRVYVEMKSNPIFIDTDEDGYSDYDEVKVMKTSPLKYNFAKGDFDWILDDYSFPQEYLDYSGPLTGPASLLFKVFAGDQKGQAVKTFINYFHNYATSEQVLSQDSFVEERLQFYKDMHDSIGLASDLIKLLRTFVTTANAIGSDKYTQDARDLKQIKDTSDEAYKIYESLYKAKAADIDAMNSVQRANLISSTFTEAEKRILLRSKLSTSRGVFGTLDPISKTLDNFTKADSWITRTDAVVKTINTAITLNKAIKDTLAVFNKIEFPCKWDWMRKMSDFNKNISGMGGGKGGKIVGGTITVVLGVADAASQYFEVAETYGKIAANCYEYQKYLDLLRRIEQNESFNTYVRDAAAEVAGMFTDAGDPDWDEFQNRLNAAQGRAVGLSVFKSIINFGITQVGKAHPIIGLANLLYNLSLSFLGINDSSKARIDVQSYFSITYESRNLFYAAVNFAGSYWESKSEGDSASKYAVQLAQSRIVGVNTMKDYLLNGKLTSGLMELLHGKSSAEVKEEYEGAIQKIYDIAKKCKLKLSEKLPLYPKPPLW